MKTLNVYRNYFHKCFEAVKRYKERKKKKQFRPISYNKRNLTNHEKYIQSNNRKENLLDQFSFYIYVWTNT